MYYETVDKQWLLNMEPEARFPASTLISCVAVSGSGRVHISGTSPVSFLEERIILFRTLSSSKEGCEVQVR